MTHSRLLVDLSYIILSLSNYALMSRRINKVKILDEDDTFEMTREMENALPTAPLFIE